MQSNSKTANPVGSDPHMMQQYTLHSGSWWHNIPYSRPAAAPPGNASNLSSSEDPNGSVSTDRQSMSNGRSNEENDVSSKELQNTAASQSADQQNLQLVTSNTTTMHDECRAPQLELVGHSVACASNPYQDPYFCGMMAAYGPQPLPYPHPMGLSHTRMPLPQEMAQEPVYVNAKQFQGIMRRRQSRAKAELEKKLVKVRKPYLHESRHQHAMRRPRGTGGRFAKKTEAETKGVEPSDSGPLISSLSVSSSGSDPLPSEPAETRLTGGSHHQNHSNIHASMYHSQTGDKEEDGSGQQWVSISSSPSAQRPLAIQ